MQKENRIRSKIVPNQIFTIYRRTVCRTPRRELCHTRDSGAVAIAPLVRRTAAFHFSNRFPVSCLGETHACIYTPPNDGRRTTRMVLESDIPSSRGVVSLSAQIHFRGGRHRGPGARDLRPGLRPFPYPSGRLAARVAISHCP